MCKVLDYKHKYKEKQFLCFFASKSLKQALRSVILVIKVILKIKMDSFNSVTHQIMYSYYTIRI